MRQIRDEEKEVLDRAELELQHYSAQIEVAERDGWPKTAIRNQKEWVARALVVLGRYDEARALVDGVYGLAKLRTEIDETEAAVNEDDAAYCDCRHVVDLNPAVGGQPQLREQSSYYPTGQKTKSAKHGGKLVELHKCVYCGHQNALPEPIDSMVAKGHQLRAVSDAAARIAIKNNQTLQPDFTKADYQHYAKT